MNISENYPDWSFVHVSDIHVGSPRSYRFQPAWNANWETARRQIREMAPELVLVGGDLTRDGATHTEELVSIKEDLADLGPECLIIPGNHEVGNKWSPDSSVAINSAYLRHYKGVFGPSEWSEFRGEGINRVRFTGIDAFKLGSGLPEEPTLRAWLDDLGPDTSCANHVWVIHPSLFADHIDEADFDREVDRVPWYFGLNRADRYYLWEVMKRTRVTHVISGHIHCRRHVVVDGVHLHLAPATAFPQWGERWADGDDTLGFLEFIVSGGKLTPRFVALEKTSTEPGYGPGGHPPVEGRDYAIAQEKPAYEPARDGV
jgi:alkaline phosphatase D